MNKSTHDEVAQRAREIWQDLGRPAGRDAEIWLEAEQQLAARSTNPPAGVETDAREDSRPTEQSQPGSASADRGEGEVPSGNAVDRPAAPVSPEGETLKAAKQKKEGRAPKVPGKKAPKATPSATGKPLWPKPHSS
jgi:hypothetical protein